MLRAERPPLVNIKPLLFSRLIQLNYRSSKERKPFPASVSLSPPSRQGASSFKTPCLMICNPPLSAWHILFHFSPLSPGPKGQLRFKSRERSISVLFPRLQTSKMQYMNCFKRCERLTWMCLRTSLSLASYLSCFYRLLTLLQMFSPEASFSATQPLSQSTPAH